MIRRFLLAAAAAFALVSALPVVSYAASPAPTAATSCDPAAIIPLPDCRGDVTQKRVLNSDGTNAGDIEGTVNALANRILTLVYEILGGLAVIMLIWSGIQYMLAGNGQADAAKKARQNITNVVLGIILLAASYGIINLAVNFSLYFTK